MVVRDDDLDAIGIGQRDLGRGGDAVVAGHDHADAVLAGHFYQMVVEPVAVMDAMGDGRVRLCPQYLQPLGQDIGRADTVHVIVSDDADTDIRFYRGQNLFHCSVHILQKPGGVAVLQRPPQELPHLFLHGQIPVAQNPGHHRADIEFPGPSVKIRLLHCHIPFSHCQQPSVLRIPFLPVVNLCHRQSALLSPFSAFPCRAFSLSRLLCNRGKGRI